MSFDEIIDYRGTHSQKWDMMQTNFGVSPDDGLAMWVADMDFRPPEGMIRTVVEAAQRGLFTYFDDKRAYDSSIVWWMQARHGWTVDPAAIMTTHGIVNAVSMAIETFTRPGDGVIVMSPVYHAFARVIRANDRRLVEFPLKIEDGAFAMDFTAWEAMLTGDERMLILCSPHNPGGRVWTRAELQDVADFAKRHDLILVSDEIHHDLVYPGAKHTVMALVDPAIRDRLIMLSSTSKTFNVAGMHCGNVIIEDEALRAAYKKRLLQLAISPNSMSMRMTPALYSAEGAIWADALCAYLDANHRLFVAGVNAIPGLRAQPMQGTYLAWVDFAGTGMTSEEVTTRVSRDARIAASPGAGFGLGGARCLRFNIGTQRARIEDAIGRLQQAFRDLQ